MIEHSKFRSDPQLSNEPKQIKIAPVEAEKFNFEKKLKTSYEFENEFGENFEISTLKICNF